MLPERGLRDLRSSATARPASTCSSSRPGACSRRARRRARARTAWRSCDNYAGGWQELFPSCNDACTYRGVDTPASTARSRSVPWDVGAADGERRRRAGRHASRCTADAVRARASHAAGARPRHADAARARRERLGDEAHHLVRGATTSCVGAALPGGRLPAASAPARHDRDDPRGLGGHGAPRHRRSASRGRTRGSRAGGTRRPARRPRPRGADPRRRLPDRPRATGPSRVENPRLGRTFRLALRPARSSGGCAPGSPTAAPMRCRSRAPTRSASSRGSRSGQPRRGGGRRARRSSSPAAHRSRPP